MARRAKAAERPKVLGDSPWSEENRNNTRAAKQTALLRAAAIEFSKRGFSRVSLDDIAAQIGISKPTIYYHVGDKDELFSACSAAAADDLFALRDSLREQPRPASQALKDFVAAYVGIVTGPFGYCLVMTDPMMLSKENRAKAEKRGEEINAILLSILKQGVKEGVYKPGGLDAATSIIAGALNWVVRWYDPGQHQPAKITDSFFRSFEAFLKR